jgi:hypothetical protein
MKRTAESGWENIRLTRFLLKMFSNKEVIYRHWFETLLYSMPLGGFK